MFLAQATQRKPECLPEQLLCSADGSPVRASAATADCAIGQWAPQRSAAASSPAFANMRVTPATCPASPLCEAQASANSSSPKPKASAGPGSTNGKACQALTAERGKNGGVTLPMASS